jgi:hypothetical protein
MLKNIIMEPTFLSSTELSNVQPTKIRSSRKKKTIPLPRDPTQETILTISQDTPMIEPSLPPSTIQEDIPMIEPSLPPSTIQEDIPMIEPSLPPSNIVEDIPMIEPSLPPSNIVEDTPVVEPSPPPSTPFILGGIEPSQPPSFVEVKPQISPIYLPEVHEKMKMIEDMREGNQIINKTQSSYASYYLFSTLAIVGVAFVAFRYRKRIQYERLP